MDNYGKRSSKVFDFAQGKHKIEFWVGNNGGQLNKAFLEITEPESGKIIPVFCTEKTIREFLKTPIRDRLPAQVHDWKRIRLGDEQNEPSAEKKKEEKTKGKGNKGEKN